MARNTIGTKRGSVRGAPPQVYIPFGSYGGRDERAPWADAFRLGKHVLLIAVGWLLLYLILAILWAVGLIPHELAD